MGPRRIVMLTLLACTLSPLFGEALVEFSGAG